LPARDNFKHATDPRSAGVIEASAESGDNGTAVSESRRITGACHLMIA